MASNVILKTSSMDLFKTLNATQIHVLIAMANLAKNNQLEINEQSLTKISKMLGIEHKTIRNNLTSLVKKGALVKAGTLPNYVIEPALIVTDSEEKALNHFKAASISNSDFSEGIVKEKLKSRGDFEKKNLNHEKIIWRIVNWLLKLIKGFQITKKVYTLQKLFFCFNCIESSQIKKITLQTYKMIGLIYFTTIK